MNSSNSHKGWRTVAIFEHGQDAKIVEILLKDKHFETRLYDDKWLRLFLFLRPPQKTYRVQVPQNQIADADNSLEREGADATHSAIHCPACNRLCVSYPQMTRKFILPTVVLHLGIIFRLIDHECYCESCHYTWNLPGHKIHSVSKPVKQFPFYD